MADKVFAFRNDQADPNRACEDTRYSFFGPTSTAGPGLRLAGQDRGPEDLLGHRSRARPRGDSPTTHGLCVRLKAAAQLRGTR